eukprot:CAMPEP_0178956736 /NCGR_PEP_ID=MMETSP0789-20121207/10455_1 /TAXON_ID=3005 /ORGANISM="Rhizosolenia setigera, Strain CCMP 1694" /LENGTH=34 /DNA_ID= /DNA_START= /DNA_END= /DNA_ORIENTATION=
MMGFELDFVRVSMRVSSMVLVRALMMAKMMEILI